MLISILALFDKILLGNKNEFDTVFEAIVGLQETGCHLSRTSRFVLKLVKVFQAIFYASWHSLHASIIFNSYFVGSSTQVRLPSHPNIIKILCAMVEVTPWLDDALQSYPSALPRKIYPDGFGRNKTMCLVMPKYDYTLHKYLMDQKPSDEDKILIMAQLLEGVAHLVGNYEAHRDLKADNILLKADKNGCPRLVITDFGCCLADKNLELKLPFESDHIDRGGNSALMAPEV